MRRFSRATLIALALIGGASATPALAEVDFRFGIDIGPRYGPYYGNPYYAPYYGPHYYHPHGRYYYYR